MQDYKRVLSNTYAKRVAVGFAILILVAAFSLLPATAGTAQAATCRVNGTILQVKSNRFEEHAFIHRVPLKPTQLSKIKRAYYVNGGIWLDISVWTIWAGIAGQGSSHIDFWVWGRYRAYYPYIGHKTRTVVEYTC